jgi:hypothetical protein
MKFKLYGADEGSDIQWTENYDHPDVTDIKSAEEEGKRIITHFNDTLRPHEKRRVFISAELEVDEPITSDEIAEKVSDVITTLESITEEDDCNYKDEISVEIGKLYEIERLLRQTWETKKPE